jgi:hypothetical protein
MGYTERHLYMTVIGDAYAGTERWQFGLRKQHVFGANVGADLIAAAALYKPIVQAWWQGTGVNAPDAFSPPNTHRLTELKCAAIEPDGTYVDGAASASAFYLPVIAGADAPQVGQLPQASVCATLTTAIPRGYASKGRLYLPPSFLYRPAADGRLTVADASWLARSVKHLIDGINSAEAGNANVAVFSKGKGVKVENVAKQRWEWTYPNAGTTALVTGVQVGRVIDTQRRRRRSLDENRQTVVVA